MGPFFFDADIAANLEFEIRGVPPGTWDLVATAWREHTPLEGRTQVQTGATVSMPVVPHD